MRTSKQIGPADKSPSEFDPKMAELAAREASITHSNSLPKTESITVSKARAKADHNERLDADMRDTIATLEAGLADREDQLRQMQEKYTSQKHKKRKLEDAWSIQNDALKKCEADRDFQIRIMSHVLKDCMSPYAERRGTNPEKWTEKHLDEVMAPLLRDALDAKPLRGQVRCLQEERQILQNEIGALQNDMLAKVEKIQAVNDEAFAQDFRNIVSLVKTLSREVRYTNQENIVDILRSGTLLIGVPRTHWDKRANKKSLVEAWFWSVLVDKVFRSPFASLGQQCEILSEIWLKLFDGEHYNGWPVPTAMSETWRYTTIGQMVEKVEQNIAGAGQLKQQYQHLQEGVIEVRSSIIESLQSGLSTESSAKHLPKLVQLVDKAFALATKMSFQRARLQVTYPKVGANFDEHTMAPLPDADGDRTKTGVVAFIVNPGLTKWGDTHGKNLDHRYEILPCLVQLENQAPKRAIDSTYADVAKGDA